MRHDPASAAVVVMLRGLKMYGMAQAVSDLMEQGSPAFGAAVPILSQLLKAEVAEREVRSIAYQIKAARFPAYKDLAGFDFASSEVNEAMVRQLHRRSGTLNFGSTVPARRYLRIVLRDKPVRRSISRIGIPSRRCQRRITLNNAMSITPRSPDPTAREKVSTWVTSQWKLRSLRVNSQRKSTAARGKAFLTERCRDLHRNGGARIDPIRKMRRHKSSGDEFPKPKLIGCKTTSLRHFPQGYNGVVLARILNVVPLEPAAEHQLV